MFVDFDLKGNYFDSGKIIILNSGIKLSENKIRTDEANFGFSNLNSIQYYNFPASYIQLDVDREKIKFLKDNRYSNKKAINLLAKQANELISYIKEERNELQQIVCENIYLFFKINGLPKKNLEQIKQKIIFHLSIKREEDLLLVSLQPSDILPANKSNPISYEVNQSFNILNLLLLECLILQEHFQDKYILRRWHGYCDNFSEPNPSLGSMIKELSKMDYVPLSHCFNSSEENEKLMHFVSEIGFYEMFLRERGFFFDGDPAVYNYVNQIVRNVIPSLFMGQLSQIVTSKSSYEIKEKFLCGIEDGLIYASENYLSKLSLGQFIQTNMKMSFKRLLCGLFIQTPSSMDHPMETEDHLFYKYLELIVFQRFLKFANISQMDNFRIELEIQDNYSTWTKQLV